MSSIRRSIPPFNFARRSALAVLVGACVAGCGGGTPSAEAGAAADSTPSVDAGVAGGSPARSSPFVPEAQELRESAQARARLRVQAGGPGDSRFQPFVDRLDVAGGGAGPAERVTAVTICGGAYVDSFQLTTNLRTLPRHGGGGGTCQVFALDVGERIVRVFGRAGAVIDQLGFQTTAGRTLGPVGGVNGAPFAMTVGGGASGVFRGLVGAVGTYAGATVVSELDLLDDATGGTGGSVFVDRMLPDESLRAVTVCYRPGGYVQSIQLTTSLGARVAHGTHSGVPCDTTTLNAGETIQALFGAADRYVNSLGFETNQGRHVGPFGGPGGHDFNQTVLPTGGFAGIAGRSGLWLDRITLMTLPAGQGGPRTFADQLPGNDRVGGVEVCVATDDALGTVVVRSVRALLASGASLPLDGGRASTQPTTTCTRAAFAADEYVTEMFGRSGGLVDALGFRTNKGRDIGPFGGTGGRPFLLRNPLDSFAGFAGRFVYDGFLAQVDFAATDTYAPVSGPDKSAAVQGWWGDVAPWPLTAIHASVLADGRMLSYGTDASGTQGAQFVYDVWDPAAGFGADAHLTLPNTTGTDTFCSAQTTFADGTVLLAGGDNRQQPGGYNRGVRDANLFRPADNSLQPAARMLHARWYASQTMLPSGRVIVMGGIDENGGFVPVPEIYVPGRGFRELAGAASPALAGNYSRMFVPPRAAGTGGDVVYVIPTGTDRILRLDVDANGGQGALADTGVRLPAIHDWDRPAALVSPTQVLVQLDSGATVLVGLPTVAGAAPTVSPAGALSQARAWSNFAVLPTGDVLATGGSSEANRIDIGTVARQAELWNAATRTWRTLAPEQRPRLYHANLLLLADGRLLSAGGGAPGPVSNLNAQPFSPPYLFEPAGGGALAARPVISGAPDRLAADGSGFVVSTPTPSAIRRATLVRLPSSTHSYNFDQRFIPLTIARRQSASLVVNGPADTFTAPPGKYYLTLVSRSGVPSISKVVTIASP